MLTFKECTLPQLDITFELEQVRQSTTLDEWLNSLNKALKQIILSFIEAEIPVKP